MTATLDEKNRKLETRSEIPLTPFSIQALREYGRSRFGHWRMIKPANRKQKQIPEKQEKAKQKQYACNITHD